MGVRRDGNGKCSKAYGHRQGLEDFRRPSNLDPLWGVWIHSPFDADAKASRKHKLFRTDRGFSFLWDSTYPGVFGEFLRRRNVSTDSQWLAELPQSLGCREFQAMCIHSQTVPFPAQRWAISMSWFNMKQESLDKCSVHIRSVWDWRYNGRFHWSSDDRLARAYFNIWECRYQTRTVRP